MYSTRFPTLRGGAARRWPQLACVMLGALTLGCEQPNPLAPAEPIGEFPTWGASFGEQATANENSMLLGGSDTGAEGPAPSGPDPDATPQRGGTAVPAKDPIAGESWGGGDPAQGKVVFLNNCARCHGADGKGGQRPDVGMVPTLRDPAWHERVTDNQIASTISHGKGKMPSFMRELNKDDLDALIAFIRTLKK